MEFVGVERPHLAQPQCLGGGRRERGPPPGIAATTSACCFRLKIAAHGREHRSSGTRGTVLTEPREGKSYLTVLNFG